MSVKNITAATLGFLAISAIAAPQLLQAQQTAIPTFQTASPPVPVGARPGPAMGSMASPGPTQMPPATPTQAAPTQNVNLTGGISNKLPVRTDLLQAVMDRQEEMLLLDLDIKKATMEKQLREAKKEPEKASSSSQSSDTSFREVDRMMQQSSNFVPPPPTAPLSIEDIGTMGVEPQVMRIRKENNEMVAMIKLEDGAVMLVREGDTLSGGWKVSSITPTGVNVTTGRKGAKSTSLKYTPSGNQSSGDSANNGGTSTQPLSPSAFNPQSVPSVPSYAPSSMRR